MKINSNSLKWSVLGISLTSILFSLLLVCSPVVGAFGGADATCSDGSKVSCSGIKCTATDNVGCSCTKEDGTKDAKQCPKRQESFATVESDF
jgi:hypothetical protein